MTERRKDNRGRVLKEGESQRKNGTYDYRWRDADGRHSIYAKTLSDLRKKEAECKKDLYDGIRADRRTITLDNLFDCWSETKRGIKGNTFANYQYLYKQFIHDKLGSVRIVDLHKSDIKRCYISLIENEGLQISTVDSIHTVVHQVLDVGVDDDYLRKNPSDKVMHELKMQYQFGEKRRKALTRDEQELFMSYVRDCQKYRQWYPLFTVMFGTGMRVGEVTGLRWEDIDLESETISVNHTLVYYSKGDNPNSNKKCSYAINSPKTKTSKRIIRMPDDVKGAFLELRERQKYMGLEGRSVIDGYTDFIFLNRFGEVLNNGVINKVIKRIVRDCNAEVIEKANGTEVLTVPKFSCHSMRHSFTTRMFEAGANMKVVQEVLGHSDIQVTYDIYCTVTDEIRQKEYEKYDKYWKKDNNDHSYAIVTPKLRPIAEEL